MGIGISVLLLAVGAILSFAVRDNLNDVDLSVVGYILMAAGLIGLAWSIYLTQRSRTTIVRDETVRRPDVY
ncbi:MAG: hypothetical protein JWL64_1872 [Frankiales bacterium]|nr:hypothetical protein [Frankiales bacterium]